MSTVDGSRPACGPLQAPRVNGVALGGDSEIALACDLAVMGADATLRLPE